MEFLKKKLGRTIFIPTALRWKPCHTAALLPDSVLMNTPVSRSSPAASPVQHRERQHTVMWDINPASLPCRLGNHTMTKQSNPQNVSLLPTRQSRTNTAPFLFFFNQNTLFSTTYQPAAWFYRSSCKALISHTVLLACLVFVSTLAVELVHQPPCPTVPRLTLGCWWLYQHSGNFIWYTKLKHKPTFKALLQKFSSKAQHILQLSHCTYGLAP